MTQHGLGRIMVGLAPWSFASQVSSLASSIVLARYLGATYQTDAYYLSLSVPALAYGILISAIRNGAIPALTEVTAAEGDEALERSGAELLTAVAVSSGALALVVLGAVEALLPIFVDGRVLDTARIYMLELAPYSVLGGMSGVLAGVLAVRGSFAPPVAVLCLEPAIKTVLTITLAGVLGAQTLVIGSLAGAGLAVLVLWRMVARHGLDLRLTRRFATPFVRSTALISIPLIASSSILLVNPVVDRTMAARLGAGSVTALEMGLRLLLPFAIVTNLLVGPIVARWSALQITEGRQAVVAGITRAFNGAAALLPPAVVTCIVLRHEFVDFLFRGGAYSHAALGGTASVFGMIVLSLPAQMLSLVVSMLFLLAKDTMFLLRFAFVNVVLNVVLNYALRPSLGVGGIALSTTLTVTVVFLSFVFGARRRWGTIYAGDSRALVARVLASVVVTAAVALGTLSALPTVGSRLGTLAVIVLVGAVTLVAHAVVLVLGRDPFAASALVRLRPSARQ